MSLFSSIGGAVKSVANKVGNAYSNATNQLQAIGRSISSPTPVNAAPAPSSSRVTTPTAGMTRLGTNGAPMSSPGSITSPASHGTLYSGGRAIGSTVSPGSYIATPSGSIAANSTARSGGSSYVPNNGSGYGGMSIAPSGSSGIAGALSAIQSRLGGDPGADSSYAATQDSYKGTPGYSETTYTAGQPMSLEAQANQTSVPDVTQTQRQNNQKVISDYQSGQPTRDSQISALQSQLDQAKQAVDAISSQVLQSKDQNPLNTDDPMQQELQQQADQAEQQYESMQKQLQDLQTVPQDVVDAQTQEEALTAQENQVKDNLNTSLRNVNDQPIPQGFLTGQGARLQDLANNDLGRIAGEKVTLQQKLADSQARRQSAIDVVQNSLSRLGNRSDTASSRLYDYQTGKQKNTASAAADTSVVETNGHKYLINNRTGQKIADLGAAAVSSSARSSGSYLSQGALSAGEQKLRASEGSDGYVDPNVYLSAYNDWPGTTAEFLSKFPPANYVNPTNDWLPAILRPKVSGTDPSTRHS